MAIKEQIEKDFKISLKEGKTDSVGTLRMIKAAIKNAEIAKRGELEENDLLAVLTKEAKKRKESIELFKKGDREDLVKKEEEELELIQKYLPKSLDNEEVLKIIKEKIAESGARGPADLGKVMGTIMNEVKGRAEGKVVNELVGSELQKLVPKES